MKRSTLVNVVLVDDDRTRLDYFAQQAKARGDIELITFQFSSELIPFMKNCIDTSTKIDLVILDVRLPRTKKELKSSTPEKFLTEGVSLAQILNSDPQLSQIPIVLYSQYAEHPEVFERINFAEIYLKNVLNVFKKRPTFDEVMCTGLGSIQNLDISVSTKNLELLEFVIKPLKNKQTVEVSALEFFLNGLTPIKVTSQDLKEEIAVVFDSTSWMEKNVNYLVIRAKTGNKYIHVCEDSLGSFF